MTTDLSIQVHGVSKQFDAKVVLNDITLAVPKAHIFGLLGPSGSGKTTLVRMIAGIDVPTSGTVHVLGQQMPQLAMLSKIGYMAQSDALYAELTAQENLEFFASLYGLTSTKRNQRIHDVMELVDLGSHLKKQISNYSGGMKRRLSLAISLLHEPGILILDEPTVGIDPVLRKSIWQELTKLSQQGTTILVTTHVMDEADKCHQLGMIRDGRLTAVGTPDELKRATSSATIEEAFLYYGGVKQ
ncbi:MULTISPECIES: ABC transporter ATP-binding protein [unclassified Paenibacillus]|uniref:ABC transporter ATP-binding protein n=1 Tax=unclassified Paenibacillus TaxID=185978 RepID=UPI002783364C|nr:MULTISPECIES: ABC transporter ATP-binding protein [unclassified Paenibacillus]MDQ0900050.1 ABC-2 type transport system ATP-binding protein [Paenibacillus sp. V4I7]MDQ0921437.1 ABC-2 type transport system ATP-binding protein [Paenibacillus sp. V4I5]